MEEKYLEELEYLASMTETMVPIIGLEMIMHRKQVNGKDVEETVQSYIVDEFLRRGKLDIQANDELVCKMKREGYHGLTLLYQHFTKKGNSQEVRDEFESLIEFLVTKKDVRSDIYIHRSVKNFLEAVHPSLILTTIPFNFIEEELMAINNYDSVYLCVSKKDDNGSTELRIKETGQKLDQDGSFIVHLFGASRAIESSTRFPWVCTERKLLLYLHSLHNQHLADFKLATILESKRFVVMGCNLPEWLFQFLLYPLKRENDANESLWLGNADNTSTKEEQEKVMTSLNEHLSAYNCEVKSYKILEDLTKYIQSSQSTIEEQDEPEVFDFFISHRKEDRRITEIVVGVLRKWKFNVWVDYEHKSDISGAQWQNIISAIEKSKHLVPIITSNYIDRYNEKEKDEVSVKELTEIAFEYMFPEYDESKKSGSCKTREGAQNFIVPILKCDDTISLNKLTGLNLNDAPSLPLIIEVFKGCCEKGLLPKSFNELLCYEMGEEVSSHDYYWKNINLWRDLQAQGTTMKELNFSIFNYLNK